MKIRLGLSLLALLASCGSEDIGREDIGDVVFDTLQECLYLSPHDEEKPSLDSARIVIGSEAIKSYSQCNVYWGEDTYSEIED